MTANRLLEPQRPLAPVQWAAIAGSVVVLVWSLPGLVVNPDFATGDAASAELVLGVDMNGWHALSGFLVAIPGFFAALRRDWAGLFDVAAAGSLIATGVWALADAHVAGGLFYLPNQVGDALLHFGTSAIFVSGAVHHYFMERRARRIAPIA
ncbi:MAG: DUF4383 domain-containing protein [Actinomycetota bacterium]|nr:DUF4383 domain-containing protein [Actinomycetota bacterium]